MSSNKRGEEGGGESRRETESHFLAYLIKARWASERESSLCSGSSAAPLIQGKVGNGGSNSIGPMGIVPSLAERSCSPSANWQSAFGMVVSGTPCPHVVAHLSVLVFGTALCCGCFQCRPLLGLSGAAPASLPPREGAGCCVHSVVYNFI